MRAIAVLLVGWIGGVAQAGWIEEIDLTQPGSHRGVLLGEYTGDRIGWQGLANAGDFNGDGRADLLVGSFYSGVGGRAWLFFGLGDAMAGGELDLDTADADLVIEAVNSADSFAAHLGGIGDINGDGCDDIAIGASGGDPQQRNTAGYITVVYGCNADTLAVSVLATDALDASQGFTIHGAQAGDRIGHGDIVGLGDFNGDDRNDFAFGTLATNERQGSVYVVHGQDGDFPATVDLASTDQAISRYTGLSSSDRAQDFGFTLAALGDFNQDGFADFVTGAYASNQGAGTSLHYAGAAYAFFGEATPPAQRAADALDGSNGFALNSANKGAWLGYAVAGGRDINGDGVPDLAVGARQDSPLIGASERDRAGSVFVLFGGEGPWPAALNAHDLPDGLGVHLYGNSGSATGASLAMSGPLGGPGQADLLIGAYSDDLPGRTDAGRAYLMKGQSEAFPADVDLADPVGADFWRIDGDIDEAWLGIAMTAMPDLDNDGMDEWLIGANLDSRQSTDKGRVLFVPIDAVETGPPPLFSLSVGLLGAGAGTVGDASLAIDCPGQCSAEFAQGSELVLLAEPGPGSVFNGWQGDACAGRSEPDCTLTIQQATAVQARFDLAQYTVSATSSGPGRVTPQQQSVTYGDSAVIDLDPDLGARVVSTTGCPGSRDGLRFIVSGLSGDCSLTVTFELAPPTIFSDRFEN